MAFFFKHPRRESAAGREQRHRLRTEDVAAADADTVGTRLYDNGLRADTGRRVAAGAMKRSLLRLSQALATPSGKNGTADDSKDGSNTNLAVDTRRVAKAATRTTATTPDQENAPPVATVRPDDSLLQLIRSQAHSRPSHEQVWDGTAERRTAAVGGGRGGR